MSDHHKKKGAFALSIPMLPTDKPGQITPSMQRSVYEEYLTRYLVHIGASTDAKNLAAIKECIPQSRVKLTAAFKSRGSLEDTMHVQQHESDRVRQLDWRGQNTQGYLAHKAVEALKPLADRITPDLSRPTAVMPSGERAAQPDAEAQFAARFGRALKGSSAAPGMQSARGAGAGNAGGSHGAGSLSARGSPHATLPARGDAAFQELMVPCQLSIGDIMAVQTMFARSFPLSLFDKKLSPEDEAAFVTLLMSVQLSRLLQSLLMVTQTILCHRHCKSPPGALATQMEGHLLKLLDYYVILQDSLTSREHLVIIFPVLLLCMRVVLETILRNTFSSLFDQPLLSFRVLSEVEAIVSCIFDPDGYHKRLPMLSSSTTGIRVSSTLARDAPHSPRNAALHSKFFTLSPVVHELAAMSQVPQIRVMAAKARGTARGSGLPTRDTISQIVPPALLTQTSRSILCVLLRAMLLLALAVMPCCCRYRLAVRKATGAKKTAAGQSDGN